MGRAIPLLGEFSEAGAVTSVNDNADSEAELFNCRTALTITWNENC